MALYSGHSHAKLGRRMRGRAGLVRRAAGGYKARVWLATRHPASFVANVITCARVQPFVTSSVKATRTTVMIESIRRFITKLKMEIRSLMYVYTNCVDRSLFPMLDVYIVLLSQLAITLRTARIHMVYNNARHKVGIY